MKVKVVIATEDDVVLDTFVVTDDPNVPVETAAALADQLRSKIEWAFNVEDGDESY